MSDSYNPFQPDSGRKEDYDGVIVSAEFKQNQRNGWDIHLNILADDEEEVVMPLSLYTRQTGDWVSYDGGETIEGPNARAHLNPRSNYMKFMMAADVAGARDEMEKRNKTYDGGRGPYNHSFWNGMRFHFDVVMEPGQRPDEEGTWKDVVGGIPVVRPTKYLGTAVTGAQGSSTTEEVSATTLSAAPSAKNAGPSPTTSNGTDIHPEDLAQLTRMAKVPTVTYEEWVDQAMTIKDHEGQTMVRNKPVMTKLASQEWFEELKGA